VPVILLAMVPVLQFDYWQWLSLALAASVVTWGAWPFHRAAWANLRHSAATMDTLISVGVLAAFSWSLYALFLGGAGIRGMNMPFTYLWPRGGSGDEIYLEVASGVTLFMLAGRFFEARAKRRSGAALRALLDLGAKDVVVLRNNREIRIALEALDVGDEFVVRPGEKIATDGMLLTGDNQLVARSVAREVDMPSLTSSQTFFPLTRSRSSSVCKTKARWSRWSGMGSTTRPRSPRPTSAWRWGPAPTSRSRRRTSRWCAATCAPR
jgi:Cu+-exporting ATPase